MVFLYFTGKSFYICSVIQAEKWRVYSVSKDQLPVCLACSSEKLSQSEREEEENPSRLLDYLNTNQNSFYSVHCMKSRFIPFCLH